MTLISVTTPLVPTVDQDKGLANKHRGYYSLNSIDPQSAPLTVYDNGNPVGQYVTYENGLPVLDDGTVYHPQIDITGPITFALYYDNGSGLELKWLDPDYIPGEAVIKSEVSIVYDTVADMIADGNLVIGQKVEWSGYYSTHDGGGNTGIVVAGGTGLEDGGSFFDITGGLQVQALFNTKTIDIIKFGAIADGVADDTGFLVNTLAFAENGSTVQLADNHLFSSIIDVTKEIKISGRSNITARGFRVKSSNVIFSEIKMTATGYASDIRGIQIKAFEDAVDYENIRVLNCDFEGYFYCTDFRGRGYSAAPDDPANRVLQNTFLINCTSTAPLGLNAGHFQHTGVTNAVIIGCSTYNGQNATSYNFINGNGYIVVSNCYDENNSYGSLEIENNDLCYATVSGNIFKEDLWIDDSSRVSITGNICKTLRVTCETNDVNDVTMVGNVCERIRVEQFGGSPVGLAYNIKIAENSTTGDSAFTQDCFLGAVVTGDISNNNFNGTLGNSIALVRRADQDITIKNNKGVTPMFQSSSGGRLVEYGNEGMGSLTSENDGINLTRLNTANVNWLDLPGFYASNGIYTGTILPAGTSNESFSIPDSPDLTFRSVGFIILIRDATDNTTAGFRVDALYKIVGGAVELKFGTKYSVIGFGASVDITDNGSTSNSIEFTITNNHTDDIQVEIIPQFTTRLSRFE
jgi:hypothetical protein